MLEKRQAAIAFSLQSELRFNSSDASLRQLSDRALHYLPLAHQSLLSAASCAGYNYAHPWTSPLAHKSVLMKSCLRFEQEARAVATLNHANILAIHDIGQHDGSPFLVSELLEGEGLRALLDHRALPQRKTIEYGVQIAHGLAAAHDKGIVHRDLKPENIFVTKDGRIKILDFGLAKLAQKAGAERDEVTLTGSHTSAGMVMGTASYMAPEQVRGEPADPRSDIFAFGAVLYEMLSGVRAFRRDTTAETMP